MATKRRSSEEVQAERTQEIAELIPRVARMVAQGRHIDKHKTPHMSCTPAEEVSTLMGDIAERYFKNHIYLEAIGWGNRALQVDAHNTPARCYLVGALCKLGRRDEAKQVYADAPRGDKSIVKGWLD